MDDSQSRKRWKAVIIAAVCIILLVFLYQKYGQPLLALMEDKPAFKNWISRLGVLGWLLIIVLEIIQIVISVIPAGPLNIIAGYCYGLFTGTVLCVIGNTAGSMLVFFLVKKYGRKVISIFFSENIIDRYQKILNHPALKMFMFISFMIPYTPKDQFCYLAGLSNITMWEWFLIVSIGRIPPILIGTGIGNAAFSSDYKGIAVIAVTAAVITVLAIFLYRRWTVKEGMTVDDSDENDAG